MYGFGKMILLAFVSVACLMSQATVAHDKMDELEDLLENVDEHLENLDLVSLLPRGMDMVNQLFEAGEIFSKRNSPIETILPTLLSIFTNKSHTGTGGSLDVLKTTIQNLLTMLLKNIVGEKAFAQLSPLIEPFVNASFMFTEMAMKVINASMGQMGQNTTNTSNSTDVKVASRAILELAELLFSDKDKK